MTKTKAKKSLTLTIADNKQIPTLRRDFFNNNFTILCN